MMQRIVSILYDFLLSVARMYTLPQLLGFGVTSAAVVFVSVRQRRLGRFARRAVLTDITYSAWFGVHAAFITVPMSLWLANLVSGYAPFLRLGLIDNLPAWMSLPLFFLAADFVQYWMHRAMHQWKWLWTFHKIHHSQREINPLTTWRTHPVELIYANIGAFTASLLIGNIKAIPPLLVGLLAASQFAQHSDIDWTYGPLGRFIVSPRFHARHHSAEAADIRVNFGGLLIIWDLIFGTARRVPERPTAYGLVDAENDLPGSFLGQVSYPLLVFWKSTASLLKEFRRNT